MRIPGRNSAAGTPFLLFALLMAATCPAQTIEGGIDLEAARKILGSASLQSRVSGDAGRAELFSPDAMRDREALALLLLEYSRRTAGWAPPADWFWGVLSVNVVHGYPTGRRIWFGLSEGRRWRELLVALGGREPQVVRSRPDILVMFTDIDCFVVHPARISGSNDAKIVVVFGRQFYKTRHVEGILPGDLGKDFLSAWHGAEKAKNPRAEAEIVQRMIWMTGEMAHFHFLVENGNLQTLLSCLDQPESDTARCADTIWEYEMAAAQGMLSASQRLQFCSRTDACLEESELTMVTPPMAMFQFLQPDHPIQTSLNSYLKFILPKYYGKQAAFFRQYWDRRE